ncbi:D-alanyl-D-alanine carboxypeptidase/D-alanyl-D-alanine-endopeptidase [Arthrobacter roseus]|uniref:D-alanyl-D-alanine carboxypeptidase/D-alanyl-D-alanine endopeptidase n=1 Tax=Arthrobacter roseus TaxID=136274 RepID=UPI001EF93AEC|nr:D-alanyl-D-alanine carboxypeptidase/D-alanyl-D-alanine-endopeptidase [Arthrobacter roseus]MBM7847279.1 D-alanyl-D-alanine carboxypeptidase/D-alanyl-D-alanine-endopeptidase (penicillin-binding protein 4) [Arthrobacter roseus]
MTPTARRLTAVLLAMVLAVLVVPLAVYAGPAVISSVIPKDPRPTTVPTPAIQLAPTEVTMPTVVTGLNADAPRPSRKALTALLPPLLKVDGEGDFTGVVLDARGGDVLFDQLAAEPRIPASNQKLLTATAVVSTLGPDRRFETSVYYGAEPGSVALRGGGDVLLGSGKSKPNAVVGHAGLQTLAERTVTALTQGGKPPGEALRVVVDDSLFTGPVLHPSWQQPDIDSGQIAPIYPLALNSAWLEGANPNDERHRDPALAAAQAFRDALSAAGKAQGVTVAEGVTRGAADKDSDRLAFVGSARVVDQAEHMLLVSDNYLAEALARMTAIGAGEVPSFAGGTGAVVAAVARLGVSVDGLVLADASGLSLRNAMSAAQLAAVVRTMINSDRPGLQEVLDGLPVASLDGSLAERFDDAAGAGVVRAKTGTLFTATSLSGYVVDRDGRLLVFSFIGNGLASNTLQARAAVDAAASALAGCGCR